MDTANKAMSDRISEIERRLGIKTQMCAGYCEQPTSDPGEMCAACREQDVRERQEDARLNRQIPRYRP
jgi:hypothetical protein